MHYCDDGVPFLRTQNIGDNGLQLEDYKRVTPEFHASLKKSQLKQGDLLLGRVVTDVMKCGIVPAELGEANCANMILIRPKEGLLPEFLNYMIKSPFAQDYLLGKRVGSAQQVVNTGILKAWEVPHVTLEEQKRIVAVLDAAFEGLTRATEHAEANLQNARELFGAFLEELFLKNGEKWLSANLQDTVSENCTLSYGIVQPGDDVEGGLPVVRPTDLGVSLISRTGLKTIAPEKADGYARTRLQGDEILLCVRGTTGVVAKALPELEGGNVTRGIVPVRFDSQKMLQDFGYYQFRSRHIQEQIEAQTYGAALRQINIRDLRKLSFTFPEVKEQERLLPMLQNAQRNCEALIEVNLAKTRRHIRPPPIPPAKGLCRRTHIKLGSPDG
ncbi:restriction endonuclease subunit S [Sulfitobacter pacificus]